uniref:Cysteine-rich with EGF-like domain protein 2 n=1 Tax=Syphacia muris TaxID=451379 RepID=A0A158R4S4_9BILA
MKDGRSCCSLIFCILIIEGFLLTATSGHVADQCKHCRLIADTFYAGLKKTERQHFAGGNTEWEERKLGKFAKSETRLVEVLEHLCKLSNLEDTKEYAGVKDLEFKAKIYFYCTTFCLKLAEENEETLENWYFHKQSSDPDLFHWLCFEKIKVCCRSGHYGKDCKTCPGMDNGLTACSGHGICDGDGTRSGTGKCKCDAGYVGLMCSNCDSNYFPAIKTKNVLQCEKCHQSCRGGCTAVGPKGCKECRSGWVFSEENGCQDIDECADGDKCQGPYEICVNAEGSYSCGCESGYTRDETEKVCKLDVNGNSSLSAPASEPWIRPDIFLRSVSFTALFILLSLVIWRRSVSLAVFAGFCLCLILYIEFWFDSDSLFDILH